MAQNSPSSSTSSLRPNQSILCGPPKRDKVRRQKKRDGGKTENETESEQAARERASRIIQSASVPQQHLETDTRVAQAGVIPLDPRPSYQSVANHQLSLSAPHFGTLSILKPGRVVRTTSQQSCKETRAKNRQRADVKKSRKGLQVTVRGNHSATGRQAGRQTSKPSAATQRITEHNSSTTQIENERKKSSDATLPCPALPTDSATFIASPTFCLAWCIRTGDDVLRKWKEDNYTSTREGACPIRKLRLDLDHEPIPENFTPKAKNSANQHIAFIGDYTQISNFRELKAPTCFVQKNKDKPTLALPAPAVQPVDQPRTSPDQGALDRLEATEPTPPRLRLVR
ncbi:hypothetical protein JMJ77_0013437 [Colletotrichum scovillei]|uniref:Uncharacterized protein n=1 Tax=Colletotrichum scovillei TaxID=1209932 RepID=A0A9P7R867_9PEZI|nr:hypothetical protein JMJ77_0013437 [Colletotrichum scovillei]KAG7069740.1 hypothetical protein JMJ76_0003403 [Colletotrichum scovillei]KAG7073686.1 hypothetical protein JMJ78_0014656 [Colletotrichum scovillei]